MTVHVRLWDTTNELDRFPLHLATTLLETIADRNQQITAGQLPDWLAHLRRTLIDEMKPETKAQLMTLDCDILAPLLNAEGFAPEQLNQDYIKTMQEIIEDWKLNAGKAAAKVN